MCALCLYFTSKCSSSYKISHRQLSPLFHFRYPWGCPVVPFSVNLNLLEVVSRLPDHPPRLLAAAHYVSESRGFPKLCLFRNQHKFILCTRRGDHHFPLESFTHFPYVGKHYVSFQIATHSSRYSNLRIICHNVPLQRIFPIATHSFRYSNLRNICHNVPLQRIYIQIGQCAYFMFLCEFYEISIHTNCTIISSIPASS